MIKRFLNVRRNISSCKKGLLTFRPNFIKCTSVTKQLTLVTKLISSAAVVLLEPFPYLLGGNSDLFIKKDTTTSELQLLDT